MTRLSRRRLLKLGAAGLAASALPSFASAADQAAADELQPASSPPVVFKYAELEKPVPSHRRTSRPRRWAWGSNVFTPFEKDPQEGA